jgi:hypothetical protein
MIDYDECGAVGGMRIGRGNRSTRRKPATVPLCPSQILRHLTWARTQTTATERLSCGTAILSIQSLIMGLDSARCAIKQAYACHAAYRSRSDVFPRPSILPNQPQRTPPPPPTRVRPSTSSSIRYPRGTASTRLFCLPVSIDVAEENGTRVVGDGGD